MAKIEIGKHEVNKDMLKVTMTQVLYAVRASPAST
jgi:hypothetical protein